MASVLMWQQLPLLVARAETHLQGRRQGWKNASGRQGVQNKHRLCPALRDAKGCVFRRYGTFFLKRTKKILSYNNMARHA